jgi:HEAT repeat protein
MSNINKRDLAAVIAICVGNPGETIEAAKFLISRPNFKEFWLLERVLLEKSAAPWTRISAAYALGLSKRRRSARALILVLRDRANSNRLRSHAAEALGNLNAKAALQTFAEIIPTSRGALRKSIIYSLNEIGGRRAHDILSRLKS